MKNKILYAFIEAAEEILMEIGYTNISFHDPEDSGTGTEVMVNVGLTGDLQGFFIMNAKIGDAKKFITQMLQNMGMDPEEETEGFGPFHKEAMGELINQMSGRSTMKLYEKGIDFDISPPTIITGADIFIDLQTVLSSLHKSIRGDFGELEIIVGIKKIKDAE